MIDWMLLTNLLRRGELWPGRGAARTGGGRMSGKPWTQAEQDEVARRYPTDESASVIANDLGRSVRSVYQQAVKLSALKTEEQKRAAWRKCGEHLRDSGKSSRFHKGHTPWNKGTHFIAGGRSSETRFKKGEMHGAAQHNYLPIGSTRIKYGNLERKVTDDPNIYPAARWSPIHRVVWESAHGPVPAGHIVVFKAGRHATEEADITLDRLECITRAENMQRNTINRYPAELVSAIRQIDWFDRKIKEQAHE